MKNKFQAMQVSRSGELELVERIVPTPNKDEVLIAVEACGICGADAMTIENQNPEAFPRIPGHEVVGRIVTLGDPDSNYWKYSIPYCAHNDSSYLAQLLR